jgi:hypothetical protein
MERRQFVKVAGLAALGVIGMPAGASAVENQGGWRWCRKCEGMWFADGGEERKGKCPAGGSHNTTDSGSYILVQNDDNAAGQQGWRWCKKCEGLWFADGGETRKGRCPAGETHEATDSGNYVLILDDDNATGQQGWRWCKKCEGLWFADGGEKRQGKCPAGETHETTGSGKYTLVQE